MFSLLDGKARISVTAERAKTANLRRDARAVLHVLGDHFGTYESYDARAEVGPVSTRAGDAVGLELADIYEHITGAPHPDPDAFLEAMVREQRLVLRLRLGDSHRWPDEGDQDPTP